MFAAIRFMAAKQLGDRTLHRLIGVHGFYLPLPSTEENMRDDFSAVCFCNNFSLEVSEAPLEQRIEVTYFWTSLIFCRK